MNGRSRLHDQYLACAENLRQAHVRLVQRYREANLRARATDPPPGFGDMPGLPIVIEPLTPVEGLGIDREAMAHVVARMEFFIRTISKEFDEQAAKYRTVGELLDSALVGATNA